MRFLYQMDRFIGKNIVWATLSCLALGVLFPHFFGGLLTVNALLFAFMTFASSLNAGFRELKAVVMRPLPVVISLVILHTLIPILVLLIGNFFFSSQPYFVTGMVLEYSVPTAVATLMWVSMYRGNMPLSLSLVLLDTLLAPFVIPITLKLLVGTVVQVDTASMIQSLLLTVALPAAAGMGLNQITHGRVAHTLQPKLQPFSKIALLLIILGNVTGVAGYLRNMTATLFFVALTVFLFCVLGYFLGWATARVLKLDFASTLSLTLNIGMRNVNAGAVIAIQYFPPQVLFPVVISSLFLQLSASVVVQALIHTKAGRNALSPPQDGIPAEQV